MKIEEPKIEYEKTPAGWDNVVKVNGYWIAGDKHAYQCQKCGAIFQSKNKDERSIFPTEDPKCQECDRNLDHTFDDLKRICKCEPIHFGY